MPDLATAMAAGDYQAAYGAFIAQPDAGSPGHLANAALLLAMCERFDEAEQLLARTKAPAVEWIVRGERARLARYRNPREAGQIRAAGKPTAGLAYYSALSIALVTRDVALATKTLAEYTPPTVGGALFMHGNPSPRLFTDLKDCDDGVGRMFEIYVDNTVVYFPFEAVARIDFTDRPSFIELYTPRTKITLRDNTVVNGFAPTLYPGSLISPEATIRTGRETTFSYVGAACRGMGQRDFKIDGGTMMGMERVAAIQFY